MAIERVEGESAKASRSRTRCVRFLASGRLLDAVSEIHDAKINWWPGDTLPLQVGAVGAAGQTAM
jgi:hypothetical protein